MRTINDLKSSLPQTGSVQWIGVRSTRKAELVSLNEAVITLEEGLEGDHYSKQSGSRMITLIQEEHIETVSSILDKSVQPGELRRNLVIRGINLYALHNSRFRIGTEVMLEGTGFCHPCSRMEENLGPGGYNAMRGHGGITARVIGGGQIKIGDKVHFLEEMKD